MHVLSDSRISEMLDYATNYGEFDENTPNSTKPNDARDTATPMCDLRRASILAYKELLTHRQALNK
jgi:hypothetical protein